MDSKSTTGALIVLIGPNTYIPLSWLLKKQDTVSLSSTEAEIVALVKSLKIEGIPMLDLWEKLLEVFSPKQVPAVLNVLEDNQATLHVCARGRSTSLMHLARTHRVNSSFLYDISLHSPYIYLQYVKTENQSAELFTKGRFTAAQWKKLTQTVCIGPLTEVDTLATTTIHRRMAATTTSHRRITTTTTSHRRIAATIYALRSLYSCPSNQISRPVHS